MRSRIQRSGVVAVVLLALVAGGVAARGQAAQRPIEPKADEVLRRMSQKLGGAKALRHLRSHGRVLEEPEEV